MNDIPTHPAPIQMFIHPPISLPYPHIPQLINTRPYTEHPHTLIFPYHHLHLVIQSTQYTHPFTPADSPTPGPTQATTHSQPPGHQCRPGT